MSWFFSTLIRLLSSLFRVESDSVNAHSSQRRSVKLGSPKLIPVDYSEYMMYVLANIYMKSSLQTTACRFIHPLNVNFCELNAKRRAVRQLAVVFMCERWCFRAKPPPFPSPPLLKVDNTDGFLMLCCFHSDQGCTLWFLSSSAWPADSEECMRSPTLYFSICLC